MVDDNVSQFYRKVLERNRKRLRAVSEKLEVAQQEKNLVRMACLAVTAEDIARQYEAMLTTLLKEGK